MFKSMLITKNVTFNKFFKLIEFIKEKTIGYNYYKPKKF